MLLVTFVTNYPEKKEDFKLKNPPKMCVYHFKPN